MIHVRYWDLKVYQAILYTIHGASYGGKSTLLWKWFNMVLTLKKKSCAYKDSLTSRTHQLSTLSWYYDFDSNYISWLFLRTVPSSIHNSNIDVNPTTDVVVHTNFDFYCSPSLIWHAWSLKKMLYYPCIVFSGTWHFGFKYCTIEFL